MNGMHMRWAVAAIAAASLLASGCNEEIEIQAPERTSGWLVGTSTRGGVERQMVAIVSGNRIMAIDAGFVFFDGTFARSGAQATANSYGIYSGDPFGRLFIRQFTETGTLAASVDGNGWTGTITAPTAALTTSFTLAYDRAEDARDSAFSLLAGDWLFESTAPAGTSASALVIQASGSTATTNTHNGAATNCNSAGNASIIDAAYGIYGWATTVSGSGCGPLASSPTYTGFGILTGSATPPASLTVLMANANFFFAFSSYHRQPAPAP